MAKGAMRVCGKDGHRGFTAEVPQGTFDTAIERMPCHRQASMRRHGLSHCTEGDLAFEAAKGQRPLTPGGASVGYHMSRGPQRAMD